MISRITRSIGPAALTIALAIALAACGSAEEPERHGVPWSKTVVVEKEGVVTGAATPALQPLSRGEPGKPGLPGNPGNPGNPGAPGPQAALAPAAPVPVQQAVVKAQPEGFNAIGGSATVNDEAYDLTFFRHYGVNPFIDTEDDNLSTFAIDVDTAFVHRRETLRPRR